MPVHAIVHVTGGGLTRRLPNLVSHRRGLRVRLRPTSWRVPAVFQLIQRSGRVSSDEMAATFNMGIGMAVVCRAADAATAIRVMARAGIPAWNIGTLERK